VTGRNLATAIEWAARRLASQRGLPAEAGSIAALLVRAALGGSSRPSLRAEIEATQLARALPDGYSIVVSGDAIEAVYPPEGETPIWVRPETIEAISNRLGGWVGGYG
jgi:hypothetical protein